MKKILSYFKDYHKSYFDIRLYLACLLFISFLIFINYLFDLEDSHIDRVKPWYLRGLLLETYHLTGYYGVLLIIYIFKTKDLKLSKAFWWKSAIGFLILGFDRSWLGYYDVLKSLVPSLTLQFYYKLAYNGIRFLTILVPLLLLKWYYDRKSGEGLYGLRISGVDLRPYWVMLAILAPFILAFSFLPDFIDYYPTYKRANGLFFARYYDIPEYVSKIIYEVFYISDFVYTELFFRGFLVVGMSRLLGKNAVLPMAAAYAILHFGKPMGEAIASVFGGYILGIIALYSRNIWGGVFIHGGIAFLMEVFAFVQVEYWSG
jgi:hypothetical protein